MKTERRQRIINETLFCCEECDFTTIDEIICYEHELNKHNKGATTIHSSSVNDSLFFYYFETEEELNKVGLNYMGNFEPGWYNKLKYSPAVTHIKENIARCERVLIDLSMQTADYKKLLDALTSLQERPINEKRT